jgi:hypothetical protein
MASLKVEKFFIKSIIGEIYYGSGKAADTSVCELFLILPSQRIRKKENSVPPCTL